MFSFPFSFILPEGGTQASLCLQDPEVRGLTTGCLRSNSAKIWEDSKGEQENSPLKNFSSGSIPLWNGFFSQGNHSIIIFTQYHPMYFGLCRLPKDPCHLVAAGFRSRPTPRHCTPASLRLFGMLWRSVGGAWTFPAAGLLVLEVHARIGFSP